MKLPGMTVVVAHDLDAAERADRRAECHVARPMRVVVHPRQPDERRRTVGHRPDDPGLMRPPTLRLAGHRRRQRERGGRVAGGERLIVPLAEPSAEMKVGWIRVCGNEWPRPSGETLEQRRRRARDHDRLGPVQTEVGDVLPFGDPADAVHRHRDDRRSGVAKHPDVRGGISKEGVGLRIWILETPRNRLVDRKQRDCEADESDGKQCIAGGEERLRRVHAVVGHGCLRRRKARDADGSKPDRDESAPHRGRDHADRTSKLRTGERDARRSISIDRSCHGDDKTVGHISSAPRGPSRL